MSPATVSRIERGRWESLPFGVVARVAGVLDIRLDVLPRWRGGELDRLLNAGHSAMHERVAHLFEQLPGWQAVAEASFSFYGERGAVDVLAWHAARRMLLVVELKTAIVDIQDLLVTVDRKRRLADRIGAEHGWKTRGAGTSAWVAVLGNRTNRARLAAHAAVLRAAFPTDGRTVRSWLRDPSHAVAALSFLQIDSVQNVKSVRGGPQRVRRARSDDADRGDVRVGPDSCVAAHDRGRRGCGPGLRMAATQRPVTPVVPGTDIAFCRR